MSFLSFPVTFSNIRNIADLFNNMTDAEVIQFNKYLEQQKYPQGIPICPEGRKGNGLYLINSGEVRIMQKKGDTNKVLQTLGKWNVFGEISLLTGEGFTATIITSTECDITLLPREKFLEIEKKEIKIAYKIVVTLAKALSKKLLSMNERM